MLFILSIIQFQVVVKFTPHPCRFARCPPCCEVGQRKQNVPGRSPGDCVAGQVRREAKERAWK